MSYYDTKFTGHSYSLSYADGYGDTLEAELTVHFLGQKGIDWEPWGSTYAARHWSEVGEVEEYLLDDMPVTYQYLIDKFGTENADAAVQEASDGAEEDDG